MIAAALRIGRLHLNPICRSLAVSAEQHVLLQVDDTNIATLTINRPEKKNCFSDQTILQLTDAFSEIKNDVEVRGLIIKAAGDYFCAGADLSWMKNTLNMSKEETKEDCLKLRRMLDMCNKLSIPTVCFVKGGCIGGGIGLCSVVKNVIALSSAWFLFSEVRLGLIPAVVSPFVLQRIGPVQCKRCMMLPERIDAEDALRIGLVDRIVGEESDFEKYEIQWRKLVHVSAPKAVRLVSDLIDGINGKEEDIQENVTAEMLSERRKSEEGREGMNCFFSRTKPRWMKWDCLLTIHIEECIISIWIMEFSLNRLHFWRYTSSIHIDIILILIWILEIYLQK